jgi:hypothetical protein
VKDELTCDHDHLTEKVIQQIPTRVKVSTHFRMSIYEKDDVIDTELLRLYYPTGRIELIDDPTLTYHYISTLSRASRDLLEKAMEFIPYGWVPVDLTPDETRIILLHLDDPQVDKLCGVTFERIILGGKRVIRACTGN